jgi:transcriptional regulator with XRE-family HTH domain
MIPACKVVEVQRLLSEEGLSQRQIAIRAGVSRQTVAAIADGSRPYYDALRRQQQLRAAEDDLTAPVERCTGCGGRTHMPCRLCRLRKMRAEQHEVRRRHRQQLRERELRRLLLIQRAIAMGQLNQFRRPAA